MTLHCQLNQLTTRGVSDSSHGSYTVTKYEQILVLVLCVQCTVLAELYSLSYSVSNAHSLEHDSKHASLPEQEGEPTISPVSLASAILNYFIFTLIHIIRLPSLMLFLWQPSRGTVPRAGQHVVGTVAFSKCSSQRRSPPRMLS